MLYSLAYDLQKEIGLHINFRFYLTQLTQTFGFSKALLASFDKFTSTFYTYFPCSSTVWTQEDKTQEDKELF